MCDTLGKRSLGSCAGLLSKFGVSHCVAPPIGAFHMALFPCGVRARVGRGSTAKTGLGRVDWGLVWQYLYGPRYTLAATCLGVVDVLRQGQVRKKQRHCNAITSHPTQ